MFYCKLWRIIASVGEAYFSAVDCLLFCGILFVFPLPLGAWVMLRRSTVALPGLSISITLHIFIYVSIVSSFLPALYLT